VFKPKTRLLSGLSRRASRRAGAGPLWVPCRGHLTHLGIAPVAGRPRRSSSAGAGDVGPAGVSGAMPRRPSSPATTSRPFSTRCGHEISSSSR